MNYKETFKIDFEAIRGWKHDDADKFPVLGFIDFYEASGLIKTVSPFVKEQGIQICPIEHIYCNFNTVQKIHKIILDNWERYNIQLTGDLKIEWIEGQSHNPRKRGKKVKALVRNSINADEHHYSPNIDENLEDDIMIFQVLKEEDPNIVDVPVEETTK